MKQDMIVILDLGKLEGVMVQKEQVPTEKYRVNDKIRGYVLEVRKEMKGNPQVIVSRSHPDFVRKLFEFEIPEIYEGIIEIKGFLTDKTKCKLKQNPDVKVLYKKDMDKYLSYVINKYGHMFWEKFYIMR